MLRGRERPFSVSYGQVKGPSHGVLVAHLHAELQLPIRRRTSSRDAAVSRGPLFDNPRRVVIDINLVAVFGAWEVREDLRSGGRVPV
ncbi:hypothetical protein GCM10023321_43700 [Pseudonocardia eucalypti]|uniref:Uncharacterized protein n=1 Tax=Pseudonocardia eucalypti TaxID=648755 RepID=A0ABP9QEN9_9PSEU